MDICEASPGEQDIDCVDALLTAARKERAARLMALVACEEVVSRLTRRLAALKRTQHSAPKVKA